mgnify:CR=1 FL=1
MNREIIIMILFHFKNILYKLIFLFSLKLKIFSIFLENKESFIYSETLNILHFSCFILFFIFVGRRTFAVWQTERKNELFLFFKEKVLAQMNNLFGNKIGWRIIKYWYWLHCSKTMHFYFRIFNLRKISMILEFFGKLTKRMLRTF